MATVGITDEAASRSNNVVGAPLPSEQGEYKPMLAGVGEDKVVSVFNPLSDDFRFQHARSVPQAAPLDKNRQVAEEKAGLSMRKDSNSVSHYSQFWVLKAGETKNLPGDIAQKAVQDLVNYILMTSAGKGNPKSVADGFARSQVEKEIVMAVHDNVSFFNSMSPQQSAIDQVDNLNQAVTEEKAQEVESDITSPKAPKKA